MDTVKKKDSDDLRVILNLSHPFEEGSVNHSISKNTYLDQDIKLKYPTTDDMARLIWKKGKKCKIFRRDLRKAYHQFFMDPQSIHFLGYMVEGKMYFDVTLSMGSRSSAFCCQRTTNAIMYIFAKNHFHGLNYLDDLGGAETEDRVEMAFETLGDILKKIGIQESENKVVRPTTNEPFLGVWYDTINMIMHITPDRCNELKILLNGSTRKLAPC